MFNKSKYYKENGKYLSFFQKYKYPGRNKKRCKECINGDKYCRYDCAGTRCKYN